MSFTSFGPFPFSEHGSLSGWHTEVYNGVQAVFGGLEIDAAIEQELEEKISGLVVYLPLSGTQQVRAKQGTETYRIEPGRAYFASADAGSFVAKMNEAGSYAAVKLFLDRDAVASVATSGAALYRANPNTPLYAEISLEPDVVANLGSLPVTAPQSLTDKLHIQSQLAGILANVLSQWESVDSGDENIDWHPLDAKILAADRYLKAHLDDPPSVPALANHFGLNHMTLKRGFRRVFDMTVYGRLRHWRIETARALLASGQSVTQTAVEVGYSNPSKFTAAFKRVTGEKPSDLRSIKT
ncbi:MAG: AraC family transcriptional regulator [Pseudomonadota bacterium]